MFRPRIIVEVRGGQVVSVQADSKTRLFDRQTPDIWIVDWDGEQTGQKASVDKPELESLQPEALAEILEQTGVNLADN